MRVLVAGGAGFIGSHLSEKFVELGHEVTVVDDFSSGLRENIESMKLDINLIEEDLVKFETKDTFDLIINLASRASRVEWETYPVEIALTNSIGNYNLIKLALKSNAKYIFASTSEVYGNPDVVPTPEEYVGRVSSVGSRSPYDESKRFGEALVKAYEREYGLNNIIIRFFNTYGPRMRGGDLYGRVLDRFVQQAISESPITIYGNGEQTRSFTHVNDTVNAILLLTEKGESSKIYNVGNNKEITINNLAREVLKVTNSPSKIEYFPLPPDDPLRRGADISKIQNLGWSPNTDITEGIRSMVSYYRSK